jgi:hypothetical protein
MVNYELFSAIMTTLLALSELLPIVTGGRTQGIIQGVYRFRFNCGLCQGEAETTTALDTDVDIEAQIVMHAAV